MMKRLKICCFLGLALLLLTLPVRGAELPPDVERALPREAGQLLKDVDHWDVNSFPEGLCAIWNHLRKDVNTVLRRQTRGAVSVLLVAVLCGLVSGFQKGVGDESRFLPMAGGLAVTALTAGSLDSLMGAGTAVMEQMNTFSKALLPTLAAVSAISGGAVGATLRQIATVFFADLLLGLIHGLLMPMVYLYAGALAAGCCLADKRLTAVAAENRLHQAADRRAADLYPLPHRRRHFRGNGGQRQSAGDENRHFRHDPRGGGHHRGGIGNRAGRGGAFEGGHRRVRPAGGAGPVCLSLFAAGDPVPSLQADGVSGLRHRGHRSVRTDRRPWRCLRSDPGHGGKLRAGAAGVHSGLRGRGDIMMAAARAWLTAVVSVTLLLSVVQTLMPKGSLREITSFVGGLLLLAVLLRPLGSVDLSAVSLNLDAYRQTVEQRQAELEQEGQKELVGLIEAELESYISDKAADMGLTLRVQVTVEPDGSGVPVPVSVELTGPRSEVLSRWLETELGVPAERQVWNEN